VPFVVTHTGVSGVYRHWRNSTKRRSARRAAPGGVVGIMYPCRFSAIAHGTVASDTIARHLEHVWRVGGEDTPASAAMGRLDYHAARHAPCLELHASWRRCLAATSPSADPENARP